VETSQLGVGSRHPVRRSPEDLRPDGGRVCPGLRPKGVRACLVAGFQHPVLGPASPRSRGDAAGFHRRRRWRIR